jgi:hypothetical protein
MAGKRSSLNKSSTRAASTALLLVMARPLAGC